MSRMRDRLEEAIPDEKVLSDFRNILSENRDAPVELESRVVTIPAGVPLELLSKSYHDLRLPIGFMEHFRAVLAIGGVSEIKNGIPTAGICFAIVYYSPGGQVVSVDFLDSFA